MPRRSSSQSHRLVELYKRAEEGRFTPPPVAVEPTPEPSPPPALESAREAPFDYQKWQLQCKATSLAIPHGSLKSKAGKRHAEAIYHYLETGQFDMIEKHKGQGVYNPLTPLTQYQSAFFDMY